MRESLFILFAGVVIGILIAPDKGSETLKRIRKTLEDFGDEAEEGADKMMQEIREPVLPVHEMP